MKDEERKGIREAFGKAYGYVSIPFFFFFFFLRQFASWLLIADALEIPTLWSA